MLEEGKHGEGVFMRERDTAHEPTANADGSPEFAAAVEVPSQPGGTESIAALEHRVARPPDHRIVSRPREERDHRLWFNFVQIPGSRPVGLDLHRNCKARWGHCQDPDLFAGFSISTDPNVATMSLLFFKINQHRVQFSCGDDMGVLTVRLFVTTNESLIYGVSMLPAGSTLTLESVCDSVTIVGEGSWYLRVAP